MVAIKYVGEGRYGTMEPKRIWMPGEIKEVSIRIAELLLKDPHFVKVEAKPSTAEKPKKGVEGSNSTQKAKSAKQ